MRAAVPFIRRGLTAIGRVALLGIISWPLNILLLILSLVSFLLTIVGLGLVLAPLVQLLVRRYADLRRRLAGRWSGIEIPRPYRPLPPKAFIGSPRRWLWLVRDPATWRDLLWLLAGAPVGLVTGLLGPVLLAYGLEGVLVVPVIVNAVTDGFGYGVTWPLRNTLDYLTVPLQGGLITAGALYAGPWLLWTLAQYDRSLLGPTHSAELTRRVDRLTETRTQVVDAQAAELRRIERDLHDGAQARIVALGMSLGMAEDLVTRDPAAAQALIAEAREASGMALAELRGLVRGIHPPVLAERGLAGGLEALALTVPLPVDVQADIDGRPPAPVESAAYFAVAEALANVVKHSRASTAWVSLSHLGGAIYITVGDDGVGGADPRAGSGLAGVERRLGAFDGSLSVDSPAGGPTVLTMELPCELSSPRISPSSATG
ncbi:sensor domain-containing protein [Dactylosporangium sp. AC04546]|uniref:sensor histidine kinase n=1 Tax=Dactylosporangium sp. AC04546 TaxID=2862460 RepID=UPI001EDF1CC7|nr:sensor domain-containing protein [Dactylosporangium sp. AC04546]WVK86063.1 sensor domain-containing protein [Dactylosporangium sp. AC04546]